MQLLRILSVYVLISLVTSSPAAGPDYSDLAPRQDLSSVLGDLSASLKGIQALLSPTSLANIESLITDASSLLAAPTGNQTKTLIGTASTLLSSPELTSLFASVGGLLTPQLITNVTDILGNAHDLLTPEFVSETKGLIKDAAPVSGQIEGGGIGILTNEL